MSKHSSELRDINYEIFILCLTLLSLVNFFAVIVFPLSQTTQDVIYSTDLILSAVFLMDFIYRLKTSADKSAYFLKQRGWIDLLSSLPLPQAKILRFFRLVRVVKIFRSIGARNLVREFFRNRANSAIYIVVLLIFTLLEYGSILMLYNESSNPEAEIKTAQEAMWYVFVTITTVGYGDYAPITTYGRLTGVLVMLVGVGLFGVLTGFLATAFVPSKDEPKDDTDTKELLEDLVKEVKDLKKQLGK